MKETTSYRESGSNPVPRWIFTMINTCDRYVIFGFFLICSIHFCQFQVVLSNGSRAKSRQSRQNCLKILISKYSHVIRLFICFGGRKTQFWHLYGYWHDVGRLSTLGTRQITCGRGAIGVPTLIFLKYWPHSLASTFKNQSGIFFILEAARDEMRPKNDFFDINICDMSFPGFYELLKSISAIFKW